MPHTLKKQAVTLVRVYTDDTHGHIGTMLDKLNARDDVIGATIFRGIAGFGAQGIYKSSLLDLSGHLPIVVEFYHSSDKADEVIQFIHEQIKNAHIISWQVNLSFEHLD